MELAELAGLLDRIAARCDSPTSWWHGGEFRAHEIQPHAFVDMLQAIARLFPRLRKIRIEAATLRQEAQELSISWRFVEILATKLGP